MRKEYNEKSVPCPQIIHPPWCIGGCWFTRVRMNNSQMWSMRDEKKDGEKRHFFHWVPFH